MNHNEMLTHVMNCDECQQAIQKLFAQRTGSIITETKIKASKENGKLGGRPKKG